MTLGGIFPCHPELISGSRFWFNALEGHLNVKHKSIQGG